MGMRIKAEMRKISGVRFARFKLLDAVDTDSEEEALITAAMRECNIQPATHVGVFRIRGESADACAISRVGGVDIPAAAIQDFTLALTRKGFEVT